MSAISIHPDVRPRLGRLEPSRDPTPTHASSIRRCVRPEPLVEHIRDVWVLHGIERKCVAGLHRTTFGRELRLHLGDELIESRLSRYGEVPLLVRIDPGLTKGGEGRQFPITWRSGRS